MIFRLATLALLTNVVACGNPDKGSDTGNTTVTTPTTTPGTTTTPTTTPTTNTTTSTTTTSTTTSTTTTTTTTTPNQLPVAVDDVDTVTEGGLAVMDLAANDTDADQGIDVATIVITVPPMYGSVVVNGNGTVNYQNDGSEQIADSFQYTINDLFGDTSNAAQVDLTVLPVNDVPIAGDDLFIADRGLVTVFDLVGNDFDADDGLDLTSLSIVNAPTAGVLVYNGDGTVDYAHDGSPGALDQFAYTVSDLSGAVSNVATVDIDVQDVVLGVTELLVGDLVITEIMQNPDAVTDTAGEWFELYNTTGFDLDLDGLEVRDLAGVLFTVTGTTPVGPDSYALFTRNGDALVNGGLPAPTYDYAGAASLLNGSGDLIIGVFGLDLDQVSWDNGASFPDPTGASMQLEGGLFDPAANDIGANWCTAQAPYGMGDLGTPGAVNDSCNLAPTAVDDGPLAAATGAITNLDLAANDSDPDDGIDVGSLVITVAPLHGLVQVVGDGTVNYQNDGLGDANDSFSYTLADLAGNVSNQAVVSLRIGSPGNTLTVADLLEGDLVITEFMSNPSAVGDTAGEWFEVYNNAGVEVDFDGLEVTDLTPSPFTVTGPLVVPAGAYVLFAKNGDLVLNGGLPAVDYVYGSALGLNNGSDSITLSVAGLLIDTVAYDTAGVWPTTNGQSMQYDGAPNASLNDDGLNWCMSTQSYGDGDLGTPGAMNSACNQAPIASDDGPVVLDAGLGVNVPVAANDVDPDGLLDLTSLAIVTPPANGSVQVNNDGTIDYLHGGGLDTSDFFTYTIDDNFGDTSNIATVDLTIIQSALVLGLGDLLPGDLVITEVSQNPDVVLDGDGEWFEVYNASGDVFDLDGLVISDLGADTFTVTGSLVVGADSYLLFAKNADNATNGGLPTADYEYLGDMNLANGGDEIVLTANATVIDEIAWDGGPVWPTPVGRSMQFFQAPDSLANDDGSLWCESWAVFGDGDQGTPGAMNDVCNAAPVANDDLPPDADSNAVAVFDLAGNDTDADDGLDFGSIVITTAAQNGSVAVNADGTVDYTYDGLGGLVDSFGYTITDTRGFESNEAFVDFGINIVGNLPPVANDDNDAVDAGLMVIIDVALNDVDADNGLDLTSVLIVSQPVNGAAVNNFDGTISYTHDGGPSVTDSFTYTIDDVAGATSNVAQVDIRITQIGGSLGVLDLLAGDLIITEIMQNPSAVSDSDGEWFEVYNAAGADVDLDGLVISDLGSDSFTVNAPTLIPAGGYALFAKEGDPLINGGLPAVDYVYGSGMSLGNSSDELVLTAGVLMIDEILWDGGPVWPDPTGASMSLSSGALDDLLNDDGAMWCEATAVYGSGDFGTPGAVNALACP